MEDAAAVGGKCWAQAGCGGGQLPGPWSWPGSLAVTPWPGTCLISGCSSILIPVNEVGLLWPPRLQGASGVGQPLPPKQTQAAKLLLADCAG